MSGNIIDWDADYNQVLALTTEGVYVIGDRFGNVRNPTCTEEWELVSGDENVGEMNTVTDAFYGFFVHRT